MRYYRFASWTVISLLVAYAVALRLVLPWGLPLWIDESWTAVLSSAPTLPAFVRHMWLDSNAPLYYLFIWVWPFESSLGLKLPSLLFMLAAAGVAAFWRPRETDRSTALFWAALLLLWEPGITASVDARYYTLLLLLSTAQTVAFLRLNEEPTLRRANLWVGLCSAAMLTHYYAAFAALFQGLAYLWRYRWAAARTWPALFLLLPAIAWFAYHFPRLVLYSEPGTAWYWRLAPVEALGLLFWPFATGPIAGAVILAIVALFVRRPPAGVVVTGAAAAAALVAVVAIGLFRPFLVDRYLIPLVPPLLLLLAHSVRPIAFLPLAAWFAVQLDSPGDYRGRLMSRAGFGLERPVEQVRDVQSATWYFNFPGAHLMDEEQMVALLEDAFARNGAGVEAHWGVRTDVDAAILVRPRREVVQRYKGWNCVKIGETVVCRR